jgi:Anti-sigma factor NepR
MESTMNDGKPMGPQNQMETAANNTRAKKSGAKPAKLSREVQGRLGQQLRAMYDDVVNQGVPDRFNDLINRLNSDGGKDGK